MADGETKPQRGQLVLICTVSVCGARVNCVQSDRRDPVTANGVFSNENVSNNWVYLTLHSRSLSKRLTTVPTAVSEASFPFG